MKVDTATALERLSFGQSAREVVGLRSEQLQECLDQQRESGGRLGQILIARGLMSREQLKEVLCFQARNVAASMQADLRPYGLPYPTFLSLCMPAYNEDANILDTLDAAVSILPEFVRRFEVIVVNDGSRDNTQALVEAYAKRDPRVRIVNHEQNRGYGSAVTSGLRAARGDLVAFTDSDGQFSFLDLPHLLSQLPGSDMVAGYRFQRADNWIRRMNAWGWNWLIRLMLGLRIRDLDCAFKLFRREVIDSLQLTATGAGINAEIMAQCTRGGLRIREVPVMHYPRYHGAPTGAALSVILRAFRELPRLWKYRKASLTLNACTTEAARPTVQTNGAMSHAKAGPATGAMISAFDLDSNGSSENAARKRHGHPASVPVTR
jgi:hypothetical protein